MKKNDNKHEKYILPLCFGTKKRAKDDVISTLRHVFCKPFPLGNKRQLKILLAKFSTTRLFKAGKETL